MTALASPLTAAPTLQPRAQLRHRLGSEWHDALGNVPLERVRFDPPPGTATEADLIRVVETEGPCELLDGTLVEKALSYFESFIAMWIAVKIGVFVNERQLGALTGEQGMMRVTPSRVRVPDVAFTSWTRFTSGPFKVSPVAADLVVEVLSEKNTRAEIALKLREFFGAGTRLAWVIDPKRRTAQVYHRADAPTLTLDVHGTLDGGDVLPGFTLRLGEAFEAWRGPDPY